MLQPLRRRPSAGLYARHVHARPQVRRRKRGVPSRKVTLRLGTLANGIKLTASRRYRLADFSGSPCSSPASRRPPPSSCACGSSGRIRPSRCLSRRPICPTRICLSPPSPSATSIKCPAGPSTASYNKSKERKKKYNNNYNCFLNDEFQNCNVHAIYGAFPVL